MGCDTQPTAIIFGNTTSVGRISWEAEVEGDFTRGIVQGGECPR